MEALLPGGCGTLEPSIVPGVTGTVDVDLKDRTDEDLGAGECDSPIGNRKVGVCNPAGECLFELVSALCSRNQRSSRMRRSLSTNLALAIKPRGKSTTVRHVHHRAVAIPLRAFSLPPFYVGLPQFACAASLSLAAASPRECTQLFHRSDQRIHDCVRL